MKGQPITGGCYCGNVRFRATHKPMHQANCHCANCRRATGAQAVAWMTVPQSSFEIEKGKLKRYRTETGAIRTFCAVCGTLGSTSRWKILRWLSDVIKPHSLERETFSAGSNQLGKQTDSLCSNSAKRHGRGCRFDLQSPLMFLRGRLTTGQFRLGCTDWPR